MPRMPVGLESRAVLLRRLTAGGALGTRGRSGGRSAALAGLVDGGLEIQSLAVHLG